MEFIKKALFLFIPITMLICCMAYGIQAIFGVQGLTYLGWTSPKGDYYPNVFDFHAYLNALNFEDIRNVLTKTFDIEFIKDLMAQLKNLWNDGYNFGDIFKTIIYGFEGIIDGIILLVNSVIAILRIIVALLRIIISLCGININADVGILNILDYFVDLAQIPYIPITEF